MRDGSLSLSHLEDPSLAIRQAELQTKLQLSSTWKMIGRWHHSFDMEQTLEGLIGAEYSSCCWSVRLIAKDEWKEDSQQLERSWLASVELKGLGGVGETLDAWLERGILSAP